jgi:hypothetical protein
MTFGLEVGKIHDQAVSESNFEKNSGSSIKQQRNVIKGRTKTFTICILTYFRKAIKETTKRQTWQG